MTNSNFKPGIGRLATDRYEFENHLEGTNPTGFTNFRHKADQIDMNPPVISGSSTVQSSFASIASYISGQTGAGQGFIAVGDGYDTWHNANGTFNFDSNVPSLDTLLNPVFQAIINGTTIPNGFSRIARGGIILIKAGTYIVVNSITVPPGITLLGEGYGTKIVNATSLNLTTSPPTPKVSPTPAPVFIIAQDTNRSSNDAAVDSNLFAFSRETKIVNMVIADNFIEPTLLGDNYYKLPQNKIQATDQPSESNSDNYGPFYAMEVSSPLILQKQGSNLTVDDVFLLGRVNFSSANVVSACTNVAISLDSNTIVYTGTNLTVRNSTIDGFGSPIVFTGSASFVDCCEISSCKIRAYSVFKNTYFTHPYNNPVSSFFYVNDNTINIHDNILYADTFDGNGINSFIALVYPTLANMTSPYPIDVTNNNTGKIMFAYNTQRIKQASTNSKIIDLWDQTYSQNNTYYFSSNNNSIGGKKYFSSKTIYASTVSGNYTIDSNTATQGTLGYDEIIMIKFSGYSSPCTVTLPAIFPNNVGRSITIKASGDLNQLINYINIIPKSYSLQEASVNSQYTLTDNIDGLSQYKITVPGDSVTLVASTYGNYIGGGSTGYAWEIV